MHYTVLHLMRNSCRNKNMENGDSEGHSSRHTKYRYSKLADTE